MLDYTFPFESGVARRRGCLLFRTESNNFLKLKMRSHRMHFSIPVYYFSIVFLCKHARGTCMRSHFASFAVSRHMSIAFLRRRVKFSKNVKFYTQRHSVMLAPEPWPNQKTTEAGKALQTFVYSNKLNLFKTICLSRILHAKMRSV